MRGCEGEGLGPSFFCHFRRRKTHAFHHKKTIKKIFSRKQAQNLYARLTTDLPREIEHTIQVAKEREFDRHGEAPKKWDLVGRAISLRDRAILKFDSLLSVSDPVPDVGVAPAYQLRPTDAGWIILENGQAEPLQTFAKKPQAIKAAKAMAKAMHASLDVFTKHGSLQDTYSFV